MTPRITPSALSTLSTLGALPTLANMRNPALTLALQHKLDNKTKPLGSLGRIEALALQLGEILGTESPVLQQPQMDT